MNINNYNYRIVMPIEGVGFNTKSSKEFSNNSNNKEKNDSKKQTFEDILNDSLNKKH